MSGLLRPKTFEYSTLVDSKAIGLTVKVGHAVSNVALSSVSPWAGGGGATRLHYIVTSLEQAAVTAK